MWNNGHNWGGDFAQYIAQAKALENGELLEYLTVRTSQMSKSAFAHGPEAYPWAFPFFLALPIHIQGVNFFTLKSVSLIFFTLTLLSLWWGLRSKLCNREIFFLVAVIALNPYLLRFSDEIYSDFQFLFFSTLSILLLQRGLKSNNPSIDAIRMLVLGLSMSLALMTRMNGVLVILVFLVSAFAEIAGIISPFSRAVGILGLGGSRYPVPTRIFLTLLPLAVFLLLISIYVLGLPQNQSTHFHRIFDIDAESVARNLYYYSFALSEFFAPDYQLNEVGITLYVFAVPFFFTGVFRYYKNFAPILLYMFLTGLLYISWPGRQGLRFLFPILPFFMLFLVLGLRRAKPLITVSGFFANNFLLLLTILFFVSSSFFAAQNLRAKRATVDGPYSEPSIEMFDFVNSRLPNNARVIFRKPRVMYMLTGRESFSYFREESYTKGDAIVIDKRNVSLQLNCSDLLSLIKNQRLDLLFENEQFLIYR